MRISEMELPDKPRPKWRYNKSERYIRMMADRRAAEIEALKELATQKAYIKYDDWEKYSLEAAGIISKHHSRLGSNLVETCYSVNVDVELEYKGNVYTIYDEFGCIEWDPS